MGGKGQKTQWGTPCGNCGIRHAPASCPAAGRSCHNCRKMNHFSRMCRGAEGQKKKLLNTLDDCDSDAEVMVIGAISAENKDWVETFSFGNVQELFKLDTRAQCNVLHEAAYKKITTKPLQASSAKLESYTKTRIKPVAKSELPCWVRGEKYQVCFQVVNGNYVPLLGRETCGKMHLIQRINAVKDNSILDEYPEVFQGLGCLPGKYHININPSVPPLVHPPRRGPHFKKKELDRMVEAGIPEKVPLNEAADWVSSLICVDKLDRSIRVCLKENTTHYR